MRHYIVLCPSSIGGGIGGGVREGEGVGRDGGGPQEPEGEVNPSKFTHLTCMKRWTSFNIMHSDKICKTNLDKAWNN